MIQHTIIDVNILLPLSIQKINTNFLSDLFGCKSIQINRSEERRVGKECGS